MSSLDTLVVRVAVVVAVVVAAPSVRVRVRVAGCNKQSVSWMVHDRGIRVREILRHYTISSVVVGDVI